MKKNKIKLILSIIATGLFVLLSAEMAFAYQYGETYNKRFKITKEVRLEGDNDWKDKVTDVDEDDVVEFRIEIKNLSDEDAGDFDDMKMEDFLPDEMYRVGGSGLTEYWDDFDPDETKKFTIEAKVESDEYDRDVDFEKCVVNKAEVRWDGEFEGSDTATVCYGNVEPTELPETGALSTLGLTGMVLLLAGLVSKRKSLKRN
jgi:hypothetical protein